MSILEEYVIHYSVCSMPRCEYVENDIEIDCDDCQKKMIEEHDKQIRAEVIEECADLFSNILSDMTNVCGINCPVKCNWGTEESCKDMCKKWFLEQLKENK